MLSQMENHTGDPVETTPVPDRSPTTLADLRDALVGGVIGGILATVFVVAVTSLIKEVLDWVTGADRWVMFTAPFVGIVGAVLILHFIAHGTAVIRVTDDAPPPKRFSTWLRFPANAVRADLTADVVRSAGCEERFPSRLMPVRALAILTTVGLGAPMGTESPAAHMGVATGAAIRAGGGWWVRLARPAGLAGGAAGIAALMGLPLVGVAFMLELGRRNDARITPARVVAATIGALVGWGVNRWLDLNLIRLIVPEVAPHDLAEALAVACLVGALSGALCSVTGTLIYRVRAWNAGTTTKLLIGGASLAACFAAISALASPSAAVGPGAGAVTWAEGATTSGWTLLLVAALRAAATTAAVAAGGCGGLFVPFLAVGDLCGRALAPGLGTSADLAAASGSAGAIAGGYRLPITAFAMVIAIGGPAGARLTCLLAVAVAAGAGVLAAYALDRLVAARTKNAD